ncbi:MAG TPA: hypothetical protein VMS65_17690, partial [Polyangiaceae bacterium]|nr:hypothetical protein [Polyangiaceae bacterium]
MLRATLLVLLSACGVEKYEFVEDAGAQGGQGGTGVVTPTVCTTDEDCTGLAATSICDTESGYCVECLPEREDELARCPVGL